MISVLYKIDSMPFNTIFSNICHINKKAHVHVLCGFQTVQSKGSEVSCPRTLLGKPCGSSEGQTHWAMQGPFFEGLVLQREPNYRILLSDLQHTYLVPRLPHWLPLAIKAMSSIDIGYNNCKIASFDIDESLPKISSFPTIILKPSFLWVSKAYDSY